jgi:hypothetical protein
MPLHDSFKATGANVRLSKLATVPCIEDLDFTMSQASKTPQAVVELPWKAATSSPMPIVATKVRAGLCTRERLSIRPSSGVTIVWTPS